MASILRLLTCLLILSIATCTYKDSPLCGLYRDDFVSGRVYNGINVYRGECPWVVYLRFTKGICTGTILNSKWILTAGHCLIGQHGLRIQITYGRVNPDDYRAGGDVLEIKAIDNVNIYKHNKVDPLGPDSDYPDDIGLIYINEGDGIPLPKTQEEIGAVNTACLLPSNGFDYATGTDVFVQGHGDKGGVGYANELALTQAALKIQDTASCNAGNKPSSSVQKEFCYLDPTDNYARPCSGDSGAPVVKYENVPDGQQLDNGLSRRRAFARGVHVHSESKCGLPKPAKGYGSKVLFYLRWIDKTISSNGPSECAIC